MQHKDHSIIKISVKFASLESQDREDVAVHPPSVTERSQDSQGNQMAFRVEDIMIEDLADQWLVV